MFRDHTSAFVCNNKINNCCVGVRVSSHHLHEVIIQQNELQNNHFNVEILGNSSCRVVDNKLIGAKLHGVMIRNFAVPCISNNVISGSKFSQVCIQDNSRPLVQNNQIHAGHHVGIECLHSSYPLIDENRITDNGCHGVFVNCFKNTLSTEGSAMGCFQCPFINASSNFISNNHGSGIFIDHSESAHNDFVKIDSTIKDKVNLIRGNVIFDNDECGVKTSDVGVVLEQNQIYQNKESNVFVLFTDHFIKEAESNLCQFDQYQVLVHENQIRSSLEACGLCVRAGNHTTVHVNDNKIHSNYTNNISVHGPSSIGDNCIQSKVVLHQNDVYDALTQHNIDVSNRASPRIAGNFIRDCSQGDGIHIAGKGTSAIIIRNNIHNNGCNGVLIREAWGDMQFNTVTSNQMNNVCIRYPNPVISEEQKIYESRLRLFSDKIQRAGRCNLCFNLKMSEMIERNFFIDVVNHDYIAESQNIGITIEGDDEECTDEREEGRVVLDNARIFITSDASAVSIKNRMTCELRECEIVNKRTLLNQICKVQANGQTNL
ncbi:hypothetical protein AKO1_005801 [Acrasis kona]|uniref:Right handed beta helix domain-containing protein n=1 Tax=Acrasis kona TaxID=1008807 RepID=A0AAW2YJI0_9EUKA